MDSACAGVGVAVLRWTQHERMGMTLDVQRIRKDFPILERKVYGKPLVYLDNAATSQKPRQVIDALVNYYENYNANIHRAVHCLGEEATAAYEEARAKVAKFINAPSPECVIFTRNTTEAINLVAYTWGRANMREGDEILLTQMEHHSNLIPWQRLAAEKGATVRYIELTDTQTLALDGLENLFDARTRMMAMPHVSNSLGTINPVEKIASGGAAKRRRASSWTGRRVRRTCRWTCRRSAATSTPSQRTRCLGPRASACCTRGKELLEEMEPFLGGGEMIRKVDLRRRDLERPAVEVRGGHAEHRRRHRLRRGDRLPERPRDGERPRARDRDHGVRAEPAERVR